MSKEPTPRILPVEQESICPDCDRTFVLITVIQATRWESRAGRCPSCGTKRGQ